MTYTTTAPDPSVPTSPDAARALYLAIAGDLRADATRLGVNPAVSDMLRRIGNAIEREATRPTHIVAVRTGWDAIEYAEAHGRTLCKYADPVEDHRVGISVAHARAVAAEDPTLIYLPATDPEL